MSRSSPEWLPAKAPRALMVATLLSAAGASAAAVVLLRTGDAPAPAELGAPPVTMPAARRVAPVDAAPVAAPGVQPLSLEIPLIAPVTRVAPKAPELLRRSTSLRLPSVRGKSLAARWIRAGNRLARHGDFKGAVAAFEHGAGVDVHSADAWYGIALCDYELRRDGASEKAATQALFEDPSHAMGNLLSGFLAQLRGDAPAARRFYDRYLAREPNGDYAEEVVSVLEQLPSAE